MNLRHFIHLVLGCLLAGLYSHAKQPSPNIVVMLADDQGWGDLASNGHPTIRTPHLDGLAAAGASFDRFYVQPVCAPTRAEFLTGRYHLRGGVTGVSRGNERLALREETIADVFKAAGYATGCFGKWHNGSQYPFHPNGRGFEEFYGFTSGHWGNYFNAMMDHNGQVVTGKGYMTDDITTRTLDFIQDQHARNKPFLAYLAFNVPHSPMQVPDAYWDSWDDREVPTDHRYADAEDPAHTRAALAMVENLDHNVGRVLQKLDELGIAENTIVVYFTDNGPNGYRWNGDMKGRKGQTHEGGVRSPLFIRWDGQIESGMHIPTPTSAIDLLPSLTRMANIETQPRNPLDGIDVSSALLGNPRQPYGEGRGIYTHWSRRYSVRNQRFMLDYEGQLFDLRNDPGQRISVGDQFPDVLDHLQTDLAAWKADIAATAASSKPAIMLGHPDATYTTLPARDATLVGELERSNRFPNDSYVRNWLRPDDELTWAVSLPAAGKFAVEIFYTCPASAIGTLVELRLGEHRLTQRLTAAWDPPETGAEHDRIPRQESYVKDFKTMPLGEIELPAGEGVLRLSCPEIPGPTALDFRLLSFRRLN